MQKADAVAGALGTRRHFLAGADPAFDPRFLVFEFTWNIMLRRRRPAAAPPPPIVHRPPAGPKRFFVDVMMELHAKVAGPSPDIHDRLRVNGHFKPWVMYSTFCWQ